MKKRLEKKERQRFTPKPKIKKFEVKFHLNLKKLFIWLLIGFLIFTFLISLASPLPEEETPLSQMLVDIKEEKIERVLIADSTLELVYKDGSKRVSRKEPNQNFTEILKDAGIDQGKVNFEVKSELVSKFWSRAFDVLLYFVLPVAFFFFIFKRARGMQDSIFSFGRSRAKLFVKGKQPVSFKDVGGVEEAKKELEEIVDFLKNPKKYRQMGARTPRGVLLIGPSGTGKTLLAKAVAGQAGVPFFSMAGSEFMEMLVGVGASVTGDTPVLIRKNGKVKLTPIGELVDSYYNGKRKTLVIPVENIKALGFTKRITGFWGSRSNKRLVFEKSSWQPVTGVFRHKVKEIYEIHFLGGEIRTTGDHSVFIRRHGGVESVKVDRLKKGDILVNLPMNVRYWDKNLKRTIHEIKKHEFEKEKILYLDFWNEDKKLRQNYEYALEQKGEMYQCEIAQEIGVCQMTVSNWQRGVHTPQLLSRKLVKMELPERVEVTSGLMKLFGYYTAEGRGTGSLEFTFGIKEKKYHKECIRLMKQEFYLEPVLEKTKSNTLRIRYYSHHLGRFFSRHCGSGSHNKHVPEFIWDLPKEYFLAFLEGYTNGDGYITKSGKLCACSVSRRLILELAWLCSMHGIKVGIKHEIIKGGRVINNKPLPESEVWSLIIGKTSNPFLKRKVKYPYQFKKCYVRKVVKKKFDGFVYDLCGVENEAFFGGEKPILLHNSRTRDLFSTAKKAAPSIIFIDELDAIGKMRGLGYAGGGHGEQEQTLNQILTEMDGFTPNDSCIVLAATNRPDYLDPALTRPGRFDRRVVLSLPDIEERKKILEIHKIGKPFVKDVSWDKTAKRTVGFSGADLENMLNEAAILAASENKKTIDMADLEEAATKVKLGPQKKRLQSKEEREMTAYHEAGHAVTAFNLATMDPVHRVSIVSRGLALGYTLIPPERDKYNETKTELLEKIVALLGGRAAEEIRFNEFTGGAASDIEEATRIARRMVVRYGMSDLGPLHLGPQIDKAEWGGAFIRPSELSDRMKAEVDKEVKKIVDTGYERAKEILKNNQKKLAKVVKKLLEKESLEGEEFKELMKN